LSNKRLIFFLYAPCSTFDIELLKRANVSLICSNVNSYYNNSALVKKKSFVQHIWKLHNF
jgi:hypothetical protein